MKTINWLILIIFLLLTYSVITTSKLINSKPEIITHSDTIPGDTMYKDIVLYKPKPYKIIIHDTEYIPKDSVQCIEDYKKLYRQYSSIKYTRDTLQNDSSATIVIGTKISKDNLDSLGLSFKNNRVKVINTTIVTYPNKRDIISIGIQGGYQLINPFIQYNINSKVGILAGYNLSTKSINIGLKYTIFEK